MHLFRTDSAELQAKIKCLERNQIISTNLNESHCWRIVTASDLIDQIWSPFLGSVKSFIFNCLSVHIDFNGFTKCPTMVRKTTEWFGSRTMITMTASIDFDPIRPWISRNLLKLWLVSIFMSKRQDKISFLTRSFWQKFLETLLYYWKNRNHQ